MTKQKQKTKQHKIQTSNSKQVKELRYFFFVSSILFSLV